MYVTVCGIKCDLLSVQYSTVYCTVLCVYVCVFFTSTNRASAIPSNTRGCQSGTWSAGQDKIGGTSTKLQREYKINKKQKQGEKDKPKRAITQEHMPEKMVVSRDAQGKTKRMHGANTEHARNMKRALHRERV